MSGNEKKVALVTGASKGIGASCAITLAKAGYRVAVHFRSNPESADSICKECGDAVAFQYDLAQPGACEELVKEVKAKIGSIDLLVNNAGMAVDNLIAFAKPQEFDLLLDTNLKPVFSLSKFVTKMMIRKKAGHIINITSVVGHTGNPGQSMYAATKGAITAFTMSIAKELSAFGIRANCVAPGFIETDMTKELSEDIRKAVLERIPLKRLGLPQDIANAVKFLASEEAGYITGTTLHVNGGMHTS
ncbi:MAG: 3-oxoacyl-ACP reductase FabG [Bdellovibrionota bacterium]